MNIREATLKDAGAISAIVTTLTEKYIAHEFSQQGRETLFNSMTADAIKRYMASGYRYHVAEIDSQLVGVVGVRDNKHLYHMYVVEAQQRKGIARQLWAVAMQACRAAGNGGEFTVNASRYAKPVYESLGFVAQAEEQEKNGVVSIPMILKVGG